MGHQGLSTELNAIVEHSQESEGFFVKNLFVGTMIDITAGKFECTIVVVNPEGQEVALICNDERIKGPDIWIVQGSGFGGSGMKVGWIGTGGRIIMNRLAGGQAESNPVNKWTFRDDPIEAQRITNEAEANRPEEMTAEEAAEHENEFNAAVEKFITETLSESIRERARKIIEEFGNEYGKNRAIDVLYQAQKKGNLDLALELLERDIRDEWLYQPPPVRGDPEFLPKNARIWLSLYAELGLSLSNEEWTTD